MIGQDLLGIEHLERSEIEQILETAEHMQEIGTREVKKVPTLRGQTLINLFFEPSTRTAASFEIAAKRLSADVVNFSASNSSLTKAESILDTAQTLDAMDPDCVVVRHPVAGVPKRIADVLKAPVVNAGDGAHEHPTQALLDMLTVYQEKGRIDGLTVAIVGDITHSRVARSNIYGFTRMGAEVRVTGPPTMMPPHIEELGVKQCSLLREALDGVDVVMMLRIQRERLDGVLFPSIREYSATFGLDRAKLRHAKDDAIVMHPGPVNRGVELSHDLVEHSPSVILDQVRNGVALRMAVLYRIVGQPHGEGAA
jgi:aspartate carbamoyltransferase catalytic subunit